MILVYEKVLDWNGGHHEGEYMIESPNIRLDELWFEGLM